MKKKEIIVVASLRACRVLLGVLNKNSSTGRTWVSTLSWVKVKGVRVSTASSCLMI
jgi:hypothetical protein